MPVWFGWLSVCATLGWVLFKIQGGLFLPWWFNTDEVVFFYEVVRQLRLDLTQTFFDIPGTPYMTLTSLLTLLWWVVERIFGLTTAATPSDFAFENIQGVHTLMRGITLAGYSVAIGLAYSVFRRVSGPITGAATAILACTLPIHIHHSHFVRTESLGLVLCFAAILALLHPRTRGRWQAYLVAGALAGAAMGARFHFALVGLPVLLATYFLNDRPTLDLEGDHTLPHTPLLVAGAVLAGLFVSGGAATLLFKAGGLRPGLLTHTMMLTTPGGPEQYSAAKQVVAKLWILLGTVSVVIAVVHGFGLGRRWSRHLLNPFTLAIFLGFSGGFLLSHPTFLWRGEHQLRSIQFYLDWIDPRLEALGPLSSWWNVTHYYFTAALPEPWLQILFLVGTVLVLWRRQPLSVTFLVGAAICFMAHPVTMKLWLHHIIPWLPLLCYVAVYPLGLAVEAGMRPLAHPKISAAILLAIIGSLGATISPRLGRADEYVRAIRARTLQIEEMNRWLGENVSADSFLAVSYLALNGDGFLKWIEMQGVSVPQHLKPSRDFHIWWLQRSTLDGQAGYVCVTRADIAFFRDDTERKNPGSTYNPFEDKQFQELATFGGGINELKVFKFDLRARNTSTAP